MENGEFNRATERAFWEIDLEIVYLQLQLNRLGNILIDYSTMPML